MLQHTAQSMFAKKNPEHTVQKCLEKTKWYFNKTIQLKDNSRSFPHSSLNSIKYFSSYTTDSLLLVLVYKPAFFSEAKV